MATIRPNVIEMSPEERMAWYHYQLACEQYEDARKELDIAFGNMSQTYAVYEEYKKARETQT